MYDAKGLDLAFGDTSDSQVIEINDLNIDLNDDEGGDAPMLVDENGCEIPAKDQQHLPENADEGDNIEFSQLLRHASFYDCIDDQGVVVCLNKTIHFLGILEICPLFNSVQVNGYTIKTGECFKVTSISHASYFLNLSPVIEENCTGVLFSELTKLIPEKANDVIADLNLEKDVVIHLKQGLLDTSVKLLKANCPYAILPHKNMILKNSASPSSELILSSKFFVSDENPRLNCFRVNEDWKYIEMKKDSRLTIVGGKNTGKSTLAQYLINQNISQFGKILLIDFDIGQPICGAVQTISATLVTEPIVGAGYLNSNLTPAKSLLFGDKSITNYPFKYVKCARFLIEFCQNSLEFMDVPWIINTMGYQKGFGAELLAVLIKLIQPSDVVQIQHANQKFNFEHIINESFVNESTLSFFDENNLGEIAKEAFFTTHVLPSLVNNNRSLNESTWISNATEKRKMSLIAHLSKLMRNDQAYLNDVVPYRLDSNQIHLIIMDETHGNETESAATTLDIFNGNLIYLCAEYPLENSMLECYGVGLVRAIDKIHGYMYVLIPQQLVEKLESINAIAIGNVALPSDILLKQNFTTSEGSVPFVTLFKNNGAKKYMNKRNIKDAY